MSSKCKLLRIFVTLSHYMYKSKPHDPFQIWHFHTTAAQFFMFCGMLTFYRLSNTSQSFERSYCACLQFEADQDILPCLTLGLKGVPSVGCRDVFTWRHCVTSQKNKVVIDTAVEDSNYASQQTWFYVQMFLIAGCSDCITINWCSGTGRWNCCRYTC